jgi:hypothetical protein
MEVAKVQYWSSHMPSNWHLGFCWPEVILGGIDTSLSVSPPCRGSFPNFHLAFLTGNNASREYPRFKRTNLHTRQTQTTFPSSPGLDIFSTESTTGYSTFSQSPYPLYLTTRQPRTQCMPSVVVQGHP